MAHISTDDNEIYMDKTTLLCLPNELLIEVIAALPLKDRRNISFTSQRLMKLERMAGKIRFQGVFFHNVGRPKFEVVDDNMVLAIKPTATLAEIAEIFGETDTEQLKIEGHISTAFDSKLRTVFKSLNFKRLSAKFNEDYSGRIVGAVLNGRKDVESIEICWKTLRKEVDNARNILKNLPPVKACKLLVPNYSRVITDEIFLHLVNTVSIACSSDKYIHCFVDLQVFEDFELNFAGQYHREQQYHYDCFVHLESSTILRSYCDIRDRRGMLVDIYRYNLIHYFS